jgi:hypothetical protein
MMVAATLLNKRYALTAMHCVQDNGVVASSAVVGSSLPINKGTIVARFLTAQLKGQCDTIFDFRVFIRQFPYTTPYLFYYQTIVYGC